MCFSRWRHEPTVVRPHHRTLLSNNKQQTSGLCNDLDEPQPCAEWQNSGKDTIAVARAWVDEGYAYEETSRGRFVLCPECGNGYTNLSTFYNSQNYTREKEKVEFSKGALIYITSTLRVISMYQVLIPIFALWSKFYLILLLFILLIYNWQTLD